MSDFVSVSVSVSVRVRESPGTAMFSHIAKAAAWASLGFATALAGALGRSANEARSRSLSLRGDT